MHNKKHVVVSGRALYLAIIISFIAAVLAFLFIISRYYRFIEVNRLNKQQELSDNVVSAINIAMQDPDFVPFDEAKQVTLFNDTARICSLIKKHWGVHLAIQAESSWKNLSFRRLALVGRTIGGSDAVGLYLTDHGHYLAVAGDTYLSGRCYLPKLGARKAYIDGKSFKYRDIVHGETHTSSEKLPSLPDELSEYLESDLFGNGNNSDSLVNESYLNRGDLERSFRKRTVRIYDENEIVLSNVDINGNFRVQSAEKIIIRESANLENIVCIAPVIEVKEGFNGAVQLFALDTLLLEEDVNLQYPSALVLSGFGRSSIYMDIASDCNIAGSVLLFTDSEEGTDVILTIADDTEINGQVYCTGKVSLRGSVNGSLYCDRLFLQTRQGYYENHLLDAHIDPTSLTPAFAGGVISDMAGGINRNRIVEWLN